VYAGSNDPDPEVAPTGGGGTKVFLPGWPIWR